MAQLSQLQQTTQAKIILKAQLEKIRLSFLKYFQQESEGKLKKSILLEKQKKMKDKLTRELTFAETRFELAQAKEEELEKTSITALQKVNIS